MLNEDELQIEKLIFIKSEFVIFDMSRYKVNLLMLIMLGISVGEEDDKGIERDFLSVI